MPHSAASDLGLHCLPTSHKKDASLIWVKPVNHVINKRAFEVKYCRIINTWMIVRYAVTDLTLCKQWVIIHFCTY